MYLDDHPMKCCAMVQASNIGGKLNYDTGEYEEDYWDKLFAVIEAHQLKHRRNCAMMSLSSAQPHARAAAEKRGWTKLQEFYNPNSSNTVAIYTKVLWPTAKDYAEYAYKNPDICRVSRDNYIRGHGRIEVHL